MFTVKFRRCTLQTVLAEDYDAWYRTPRGAWIGDVDCGLPRAMLGAVADRVAE